MTKMKVNGMDESKKSRWKLSSSECPVVEKCP
jgi:hypothetical protein